MTQATSGTDAAQRGQEDVIASLLKHLNVTGASRRLDIASLGLAQALQRLDEAAADGVGSGLRTQLGVDVRVTKQSKRNVEDNICYLKLAESVLGDVTRLLTSAAEWAAQARMEALSDASRARCDAELQKLNSTLCECVEQTRCNGVPVYTALVNAGSPTGCATACLTVRTLGSGEGFALRHAGATLSLLTPAKATAAGLELASTLLAVHSLQVSLGASLQRLAAEANLLGLQGANLTAAHSQLRESHLTEEIVNLTKFQLLRQAGPSVLEQATQATQASQQILALLWQLQSGRPEYQAWAKQALPQLPG